MHRGIPVGEGPVRLHSELQRLVVDLQADLAAVRVAAEGALAGTLVCANGESTLREGEPWPLGPAGSPYFIPTSVRLSLAQTPRAVATLPLGRGAGGDLALVMVWCQHPAPDDVAVAVGATRLGEIAALAQEYERIVRLELASARADAALGALDQAVATIDDVRVIGTVNPAAAQLLGVPAGEVPVDVLVDALAALERRVVNDVAMREIRAGLAANPRLEAVGVMWEVAGGGDAPARFLRVSTRPLDGVSAPGRVWVFDDVSDEVRARRDAEETRSWFRLLAENASDVVFSGTNEGLIEWTSPSVESVTGWHPDDLVGRAFTELIHPDDLPVARAAQHRLLEGEPAHLDVRIRHKGGGYSWVSISARPVLDDEGNVVGRIGGWRDIQAQREQWEIVAEALEGMPEVGIIIFDTDMRFRVVRGGGLVLTPAQSWWEGQLARDVVPPSQWDETSALYETALRGDELETEVAGEDARNTFLMRVRPLRRQDGAVIGGVVMVTDITGRVEVEQAIKRQNEQLRAIDEWKDRMIATVSHELRTPVTSLSLLFEMLADEELPESTRPLVDVGERSARRLRHLVEDLLLLAEAEHDGLSFTMTGVAPDEIAVAVADEMAITAAEHGVSLEVDALPVPGAMGDRSRLEQVMVNLVGNAIKFTPDGGHVTLRVRPTDAGWVLSVHDTGIGVPADEISHLFDPFFRASTATKAVIGGSGLGMAVVQQVVRGHGGTAAVSSSPGAGTQVDITFPLVPSGHAGG